MKKVLIINGHPNPDSFNYALSEAYKKGANTRQDFELKQLDIARMDLENPFLKGFKNITIPPDIKKAQDLINWADHLVWFYPTWWATMPAMMKSFIEWTLLPGFAFKYKKSKTVVKWDKYLTNKTARLISTMDTPPWYYKLIIRDPGYRTMNDILKFCGITPVKRTYFGSVKMSDEKSRAKWLAQVESMGRALA